MATSPDVSARAKPGSRGARTRARLMDAARNMLRTASPLELTAIAVSRAAGIAPPSFYVYFADTRDLLLALAADASEAMKTLGRHFEGSNRPGAQGAKPVEWAQGFVRDFVDTWDAHCEVLAYRNLEADRGDRDFDELRVNSSLPVLNGLTDLMLALRPEGTRRVDVFSEAVIYYAVLERLATIERTTQRSRLQPRHYKAALARMIGAAVGETV